VMTTLLFACHVYLLRGLIKGSPLGNRNSVFSTLQDLMYYR